MTITYATGVGGYSARRFVCTHNDPLCSDSAVVIVLEDGRWYGDALCADHAPTSALQPHAAAEPARGCTPPAATEGQGAVHPSAAASAPGGPISETVVPARGDVIPAGSVGVMGHLFPIRKVCVGHAYARNGNAHNPTPRYEWQAEVNGRWIGHDATRRSLVELLWIGVESGEFVPAGAA